MESPRKNRIRIVFFAIAAAIFHDAMFFFLFAFIALAIPQGIVQTALGNVAILLLLYAPVEAYFVVAAAFAPDRKVEQIKSEASCGTRDEGFRGYKARPGTKCDEKLTINNQVIYYLEYHINDLGLRKSLFQVVERPVAEVSFFGGSYVFGQGVENHETMAAQLNIQTRGLIRTNLRIPRIRSSANASHPGKRALLERKAVRQTSRLCLPCSYGSYRAPPRRPTLCMEYARVFDGGRSRGPRRLSTRARSRVALVIT